MVVGLLGGLAYVGMLTLANWVQLKPREISVTIPHDKLLKRQ
jgi:hypothetical protein